LANYLAHNWSSNGGAIGTTNQPEPLIMGNYICYNEAGSGAGILFHRGTVKRNHVVYNTAWSYSQGYYYGSGGGIYNVSYGSIIDNFIAFNLSKGVGGGLYLGAPSMVVDTIVYNNVAEGGTLPQYPMRGGGIYINGNLLVDTTIIYNSIIADNKSTDWGGGISLYSDAKTLIVNCTIVHNSAIKGSGTHCFHAGTLTASNCIFHDDPQNEIYYDQVKPDITYSNVWGGFDGEGNIDADPLFVNSAGCDFHLLFKSSCRNAGTNAASLIPDFDFDGHKRIIDGIIDMGADEFGPHMYFTGDAFPGGIIKTNFIGYPTNAATLFAGTGLLQNPVRTKYGNWYLDELFLTDQQGLIPFSGHMGFESRIPPDAVIPLDIFGQSLIRNELTGCATLEIREKP